MEGFFVPLHIGYKYAAPEQFGFRQSDVRTDIYAMGVMMNYLLTKKYPDELCYNSPKYGKFSMSYIINKCIEFLPDNRYQTVTELRKDLQSILAKTEKMLSIFAGNVKQREKISKKRGMLACR